MIYLKQSTASQEFLLGPFVDDTDGKTAETALTIANTDIKIWVAGATTLANKNSGGATHISNGNYYCVLDATDTATLGSGAIVVQVSGALAVRHNFCILAANVYDSVVGGGDLLDVSTTQWNGTAVGSTTVRADLINVAGAAVSTSTAQLGVNVVNAGATAWGSGAITAASIASNAITSAKIATDAIGASQIADGAIDEATFATTAGAFAPLGIIDQGTAQSATSTTVVLRSAATFADDALIGATILVFGSTQGYWQARAITDNVSSSDTVTVDAWTVTPSGTITYKIIGTPPASTSSPVPANIKQINSVTITGDGSGTPFTV